MLFLNDSGTFQSDITRFSLTYTNSFSRYSTFFLTPSYISRIRTGIFIREIYVGIHIRRTTDSCIYWRRLTWVWRVYIIDIYIYIYIYIVSRLTRPQNFHLEFVSWLISTVTSAQRMIGITMFREHRWFTQCLMDSWFNRPIVPIVHLTGLLSQKWAAKFFFLPISLSHFGRQVLSWCGSRPLGRS